MEVAWLVLRQFVIVLCIIKATCRPLPQMRTLLPSFRVLRNHTIPCPRSLQTRGLQRSLKHVELTNSEKLQILQSLGGQYMPNYMATDEAAARLHFHNLLGIPRKHLSKMNVQQQTTQNVIIKSDIIDSIRQYLSGHGTDGSATYGEDRRTIVEGTRRRSRRSDFLDETQGTFNDQVDIGEETVSESGLYVVPPETIGIRRPTRDISDGHTSIDYCINRGSPTPDGAHLQLCTTCAATTTLPTNHWPRVINEATCGRDNTGCLHADGIAHGRCEEVVIPMNLLRKNTGNCVLATRGNEHVIVDDWEIYTQRIRVGCKCTVDATSFFADFV